MTRSMVVGLAVLGACGQHPPELPHVAVENTASPDAGVPDARPPPREDEGRLRFLVEPSDATISIVGLAQHVGGRWVVDLPPGTYRVEIRRDGYAPSTNDVEIDAGETQTVRAVLEPASP